LAGLYGADLPATDLLWIQKPSAPADTAGEQGFSFGADVFDADVTYASMGTESTVYDVVVSRQTIVNKSIVRLEWPVQVDSDGNIADPSPPTELGPAVAWYGKVLAWFCCGNDANVLRPKDWLGPDGASILLVGKDRETQRQIRELGDGEQYGHFWGRHMRKVGAFSTYVLVTDVRPYDSEDVVGPEAVDGWEGVIESGTDDDYFALIGDHPARYGIGSPDSTIAAELESYRDTGTVVRINGSLTTGVMDAYGISIDVTDVEVVSTS
jgi:hypothetical protein